MAIFELFVSYGMTGLFVIGILSSIIPIPMEPVVLGLLDIGENSELVFIVLITGSILGAFLGYLAGKYELRRFMPFQDAKKEKKGTDVLPWIRADCCFSCLHGSP